MLSVEDGLVLVRVLLAANWVLCAHIHLSDPTRAAEFVARLYPRAAPLHSILAGGVMLAVAAALVVPVGDATRLGGLASAFLALLAASSHRFWGVSDPRERLVEEALLARALGVAAASIAVAAYAAGG